MLDFLSTANQIKNKLFQLWGIKFLRYAIIAVIASYCIYNWGSNVASRMSFSLADLPQTVIAMFVGEEEVEEAVEEVVEEEVEEGVKEEQLPSETQSSGEQSKDQEQTTDSQSKDQEQATGDSQSKDQEQTTGDSQTAGSAPVAEEAESSLWEQLTSWFSSNRVKGGSKSSFDVWQGILMFWSVLKVALPWMIGIYALNWFFNRKKAAPLPILDNQNTENSAANEQLPELYKKGEDNTDENT